MVPCSPTNSSLTGGPKPSVSEVRYALDASALLAIFFREPGNERVHELLHSSVISSVNISETVAKLQERGTSEKTIVEAIADLRFKIVDFDTTQAIRAGRLRIATRERGLSLGDRACLALAIGEGAIAVTADRSWADLVLPVEVVLVRP
jgi:ribonuclease VapC